MWGGGAEWGGKQSEGGRGGGSSRRKGIREGGHLLQTRKVSPTLPHPLQPFPGDSVLTCLYRGLPCRDPLCLDPFPGRGI
jgi:hypothetical protein